MRNILLFSVLFATSLNAQDAQRVLADEIEELAYSHPFDPPKFGQMENGLAASAASQIGYALFIDDCDVRIELSRYSESYPIHISERATFNLTDAILVATDDEPIAFFEIFEFREKQTGHLKFDAANGVIFEIEYRDEGDAARDLRVRDTWPWISVTVNTVAYSLRFGATQDRMIALTTTLIDYQRAYSPKT